MARARRVRLHLEREREPFGERDEAIKGMRQRVAWVKQLFESVPEALAPLLVGKQPAEADAIVDAFFRRHIEEAMEK